MSYTSIRGSILGYSENALLFKGVPVSGEMPTALGRGRTIYVDSAVAGSSGDSPDTALATLDSAFAKCVANRGDTIVVLPNHAETVTGVAGIAHDVAGVRVIGLGHYNQRPRFLMDGGTTVTYVISAADAYVSGLEFASGHSNVATCIGVTAVGAWIDDCKFSNNTTNEDFLVCVTATGAANTADGLKVTNCQWHTIDVDDTSFISIIDDLTGLKAWDNFVVTAGTASPLITSAGTKVLLNADVRRNFVQNAMTAGAMFIVTGATTNTGIIAHNRVKHLDVTSSHTLVLVTSGFGQFDNLSTSATGLSGFVLPAIDVNL